MLDQKLVDAFGRLFCIASLRLLQRFVPNWQTDGDQSGFCSLACQPTHGNLLYIFRDGCKKLPECYSFYLQPGAFVTVQHCRNCHPDSRRLLPFQGIPLPHRPENPYRKSLDYVSNFPPRRQQRFPTCFLSMLRK